MELKFVREVQNQVIFLYNKKIYIGIPHELDLASKFKDSAIYFLHQLIAQKDLPINLIGIKIDYLFEEKKYNLNWICYFDVSPSEDDQEILSDAFGNILGDMPNISNADIAFQCNEKYLNMPLPELLHDLNKWVYIKA